MVNKCIIIYNEYDNKKDVCVQDIYSTIKKDRQIKKFCMYGFLKNLKFFEPFLIIYLLSMDLSLLTIGILYSIREVVNYIFEIPSGVLADNYGKKTVLSLCFIFYIISFVFFYFGTQFWILCCAMIFFGLGEAFRSGTHKAMIYTYLENQNWFDKKSFVYGRTRSFSLIGSSISSIISIVFILSFEKLNILFLLCIVPYVLDFILILSYPKNLNIKHEVSTSVMGFLRTCRSQFKSIFTDKSIMRIISASSLFGAIFKSIKDYIQPILQAMIISSSVVVFSNLSTDTNLKILLAVIYAGIYFLGSFASRNIYKLTHIKSSASILNIYFDILAVVLVLISLFIKLNIIIVVVLLYFALYLLRDSRKPIFVDVIGDFMGKTQRATVLSVENQLKTIFVAIFAPLFGFIADSFSISTLFLVLGLLCLTINRFISIPTTHKQ